MLLGMRESYKKERANPSWPRVLRRMSRDVSRSVDRGERPTRLRILRGESPRAVNCLYSDGKHIRCMRRQQSMFRSDVKTSAALRQYAQGYFHKTPCISTIELEFRHKLPFAHD